MAGRTCLLLAVALLAGAARATPLRLVAVEPPLEPSAGPDYHLEGAPPPAVGALLLVTRPQRLAAGLLHVPVAVVRVIHVEGSRAVARLDHPVERSGAPFLEVPAPMVGDQATPWTPTARLALPDQVLFAFDRSDLRPEARRLLLPLARRLAAAATPVEVHGHTDAIGSAAYNLALSRRRAQAVARFLEAHGVAAERIRVVAHGEAQPAADNATPEGRARNRRVEVAWPVTAASSPGSAGRRPRSGG